MNQDFVSEKITIKTKTLSSKLHYQESFFIMLHGGKNFREFNFTLSQAEAAIEMLHENGCMLYDTQIIPLNIALLGSS